MTSSEWTFIFFRHRPKTDEDLAALTSSMQSFETTLLLIGLSRHPHAISACASAIESAIKSSPAGALKEEGTGLRKALKQARRSSTVINQFSSMLTEEFINARNNFTHKGFSPRDDSEAIRLLLEVGFPLLALCYEHLYSFDLWQALLEEVLRQLRVANEVLARTKSAPDVEFRYCVRSLVHLIRWSLGPNFSTDWQSDVLEISEENGYSFGLKQQRKDYLERNFNTFCIVDCPLCRASDDAVCELDDNELDSSNLVALRVSCVNCGFTTGNGQQFLSEAVMGLELDSAKERVLREYGI